MYDGSKNCGTPCCRCVCACLPASSQSTVSALSSTSSVRTALITGRPVRFYLSPLDGPDFPWVSFPDIASLLLPSPADQAEAGERWEAEYPDLMRRADDRTMIVPDFCPRGMFQWCGECGLARARSLARSYEEAAAEVLTSLYGHLPKSILTDFIRKASLRNTSLERVAHAN